MYFITRNRHLDNILTYGSNPKIRQDHEVNGIWHTFPRSSQRCPSGIHEAFLILPELEEYNSRTIFVQNAEFIISLNQKLYNNSLSL